MRTGAALSDGFGLFFSFANVAVTFQHINKSSPGARWERLTFAAPTGAEVPLDDPPILCLLELFW